MPDCESKSRALTLLNYGLWNEPCARLLMFLAVANFGAGQDDVQHEMGHALSDLDHTITDPRWFYRPELLHAGSADPGGALKMTRHKIHVGYIKNASGTWKFAYKELPNGYGGAVRGYITTLRPAWVVNAGFNGWT